MDGVIIQKAEVADWVGIGIPRTENWHLPDILRDTLTYTGKHTDTLIKPMVMPFIQPLPHTPASVHQPPHRTRGRRLGALRLGLPTAIALGVWGSALALPSHAGQTIAQSTYPGVAATACPEHDQTQLALNQCAANWARTADFLRSLIYEQLYWQLSEPLQAQLVTTEQGWESFRENHCRQSSEPFRGGSIYALLYQSCRANVTNDRIADLQAWGETQLRPAEATLRLNVLLDTLELKDTYVQRQWERYQSEHCQFEAQYLTEQPDQAELCHQRLTEARIRQLEMMEGAH